MNKRKLYIIRHGETAYNRMGIVQGSGVDMPLNDMGQLQAKKFYEAYQYHPFDVIYTSALQRTRQSVQLFIDKGLPHYVDDGFNEISWGIFEGKPQDATQKHVYNQLISDWNDGRTYAHIPQGESPEMVVERQQVAMRKLLDSPYKHVLLCMHGRAMKILLCQLLRKPLNQMEEFPHSNLCLYVLEFDNEQFTLIKSNDTQHLL